MTNPTYCEDDPTVEWVCVQPNCDGIHHFFIRRDEPIPYVVV